MFSKIKENIEGYILTKVELFKLEVEEQLVLSLVKMVKLLLFGIVGSLFLLFLSIAIAQMINNAMESRIWGYLIISFFYLSILVILYFYRNYDQVFQIYFDKKNKQQPNEQQT